MAGLIQGADLTDHHIRVFEEATAVITGGASGIGRALGEELAARGCEVVLADLQVTLAEQVAADIRSKGGKASAHLLDVRDFSALESLLKETVARTGRLDYMFNNAGIAVVGTTNHCNLEDWNQVVDVNFRGVVYGVQAAYQIMIDQGFGHIVNTASVAGLIPTPGVVSYAATKAGVVGLSHALRPEAALHGITVSVLCPGVVRTPILEGGKYGKKVMAYPDELMAKVVEMLGPMPPNTFARKALRSIAAKRSVIIYPVAWRLAWWLDRWFPTLTKAVLHRSFARVVQKLERLSEE